MSEPWHAQSVIYAAYYLPKECPLVEHLIESYFKHYEGSDHHHVHALTAEPQLTEMTLDTEMGEEVATARKEAPKKKADDKLMRVKPEFKPLIEPKMRDQHDLLELSSGRSKGLLAQTLKEIKTKKKIVPVSSLMSTMKKPAYD